MTNSKLLSRYEALEEADKRVVDRALKRHREACESVGCSPDPQFLEVAIEEVRAGRGVNVEI